MTVLCACSLNPTTHVYEVNIAGDLIYMCILISMVHKI